MVPWMAVFGVSSLLDVILEFLSGPLCRPDCYTCKHVELMLLQNVGSGFLRCCAVIAGKDDGGGFCRVCGQATDVAQITFGRFNHARGLHYRLVQNLLQVRRAIEYQAGLKVHRAEERMGAMSNEVARMIYLNELFALERRCPLLLADDSDQEVTPTY